MFSFNFSPLWLWSSSAIHKLFWKVNHKHIKYNVVLFSSISSIFSILYSLYFSELLWCLANTNLLNCSETQMLLKKVAFLSSITFSLYVLLWVKSHLYGLIWVKSHSAYFTVQCNKGLFLVQGYPHLKKDDAFCTECCNYSAEESVFHLGCFIGKGKHVLPVLRPEWNPFWHG